MNPVGISWSGYDKLIFTSVKYNYHYTPLKYVVSEKYSARGIPLA